ncbi:MAG TPA: cytochrome c [Solirubrobacterales bacterium]|nr:cytochrome c [Solirubrobacterales bacterium]
MSKRTFIWFGILVIVLAVAIPWLAFRSKGDADSGDQSVPAGLESGQSLFVTNCGTCHTLDSAGTDGNFGPDLDELLAASGPAEGEAVGTTENLVLLAIEEGANKPDTPGRMPGGILNEEQSKEVAAFVARTAGQG